jgi:trigger factor
MNVKVEPLPHSQSLVTVEVEPERIATAREDAFRRIAKEMVIPGFRKGKAPRNLAERYVNSDMVQDQAESQVMDAVWEEVRTSQFKDVPFYDSPKVKVAQHSPLIFEITVTTQPAAQIGDYKSLRIAPELVEISDDEINKTIDRLKEQQAQWQPVEHRAVRKGDQLTIETHGTIGEEPVVVPQGYTVTVEETSNFIIPGFAMRLIDMEIDQEKELEVSIPEDAPNKKIAGATGKIAVTVKEIKEKVVPVLDDALAKTLGADDVASLTEKVRTSLVKGRTDETRTTIETKILDEVAKVSTVNFPDVMVNQQVESMIQERTEALRQQGLDMNTYLRFLNMSMDELRFQLRPQAEKRIRNFLMVEELGRAEGIVVEDSAVHAEIDRLAATQQDPAAAKSQLSTNEMHERVRNNLYVTQLFDRLIAMVTEGMTPVARPVETPMPSITDSIVTDSMATDDKPAAETTGEEPPKLIIATH